MRLWQARERLVRSMLRVGLLIEEAREQGERARELVAECRNTRHAIVLRRALERRTAGNRAH